MFTAKIGNVNWGKRRGRIKTKKMEKRRGRIKTHKYIHNVNIGSFSILILVPYSLLLYGEKSFEASDQTRENQPIPLPMCYVLPLKNLFFFLFFVRLMELRASRRHCHASLALALRVPIM